jgi:hypothetical protein
MIDYDHVDPTLSLTEQLKIIPSRDRYNFLRSRRKDITEEVIMFCINMRHNGHYMDYVDSSVLDLCAGSKHLTDDLAIEMFKVSDRITWKKIVQNENLTSKSIDYFFVNHPDERDMVINNERLSPICKVMA